MVLAGHTLVSSHPNYSIEQARAIKALRERRMFKLICGATYSDFNSVARYAEIFARAGAHIIDISAHPTVVTAAKEGILRAGIMSDKHPAIMVSLSLDHQHDPHFRRVALTESACDTCGVCIPACPTQAFSIKDAKLSYQKERCYGCGACVPLCHIDALIPQPIQAFQPAILPELWELGARCLEIHVGPNFYWLEPYLQKIQEISPEPWLISVCLGSGFSSFSELIEQAREVHNILGDWTLVQVDGRPMTGFGRQDSLMLQALSAAQAVLEANRPLFVQVSGGINDRIRPLLNQFDVKAHGVGMGSYAKKVIEPYLNNLETAVQIATNLVLGARPI
jgi:Fe-S-cluster-containing hydrogenase component 2